VAHLCGFCKGGDQCGQSSQYIASAGGTALRSVQSGDRSAVKRHIPPATLFIVLFMPHGGSTTMAQATG
jgi:hypothetical protein